MNKFRFSFLLAKNSMQIAILALLSITFINTKAQVIVFGYTGSVQTYTVPPGITCLLVEARGARGGGGSGGNGSVITNNISVTPGQVLEIYVGGQGQCPAGGWNGGGTGFASNNGNAGYNSCGGGGASDVRFAPYGLGDRVIVAGGGGGKGGGSSPGTGGSANCMNGNPGTASPYAQPGGGGTAVSGGNGGTPWAGTPPGGSPGTYGNGGMGGNWGTASGGGGGGGVYGGGGGGNDGCCTGANGAGGGGAGSSMGGACVAAGNAGDGQVTITIPLPPIVANDSICGGTTTSITASGSPSGQYNWYADALGDTLIGTGPTYNTPVISGQVTYYVASYIAPCQGPLAPVTISMYPNPTAGFTFDNTVCVNSSAAFDGSTSVPVAPAVVTDYAWDFQSDGTYDANSAAPNTNFTYNATGNYDVTMIVTSSGGCKDTLTQTITIIDLPVPNFTWPNQICTTTLTLDGSTSTATPPQNITTYNWDYDGDGVYETANAGVNPTNTFPGTGNTTVGLQVVTNEGCIGTVSNVLNIPANIVPVIVSNTPITCFGANDGKAVVNGNGGVPPYSYSWNTAPIQTDSNAVNLGPGNYTATVTDSTGCFATVNTVIVEPPPVDVTFVSQGNVTCNGLSDGTATVTAVGGTGALVYSWNTAPSQAGATAINMPAGVFWAYAHDANLCVDSIQVTITEPTQVTATASSTDVTCFAAANGTLTGVPGGGTLPYASTGWNTVPATVGNNANNVGPGTFTYSVVDANGCTATANATVNEPIQISLTTSTVDVNCPGAATGSATVNILSGGIGAISYSWNSAPPQNTSIAQNLQAGTYTVTVTDGNGCNNTANVTLNTLSLPLQVTGTITDVSCGGASDGSVTLNITQGTAPYQFSWFPNNAVTQDNLGLSGGMYTVSITDANGCVWPSVYTVNEAAVLNLSATVSNVMCHGANDGSIKLNVTGGTAPFIYSWNGVTGSATYGNLPMGVYTGAVVDAAGCTASVNNTITEPTQITIDFNPEYEMFLGQEVTLITNPQGGTGGLNISWSPSNWLSCDYCSSPVASPVRTTIYTITATDQNNCTVSEDITVNIIKVGPFIPSAFTPNGDNKNENFKVIAYGITDFSLRIFDRWGNLLYITDDIYKGWDGQVNEEKAEAGQYAYRVSMKYLDGKTDNINGSFFLVR